MEKSIIEEHLYLPKVMAARYKSKGIEYDDLVQEGNIGLLQAAKRFDSERGVKFSTYATFWVKQAVLDAITAKSRTVKLPAHIVSLKLKVYKFSEKFLLSTGFEPDIELIAKELKVDKYKVEQVLNITTEHTGDWEPIEDCTIEDEIEQENTMEHVLRAIRSLSIKERLIIGMKYSLLKSI
ncbi:MAG: sigma-70 family RNA polymerase sigma factor [Campylobacterota bacterium]|nr:sigma-70 family RNA polymerase sigma factor [Campylobacterota bacterium]